MYFLETFIARYLFVPGRLSVFPLFLRYIQVQQLVVHFGRVFAKRGQQGFAGLQVIALYLQQPVAVGLFVLQRAVQEVLLGLPLLCVGIGVHGIEGGLSVSGILCLSGLVQPVGFVYHLVVDLPLYLGGVLPIGLQRGFLLLQELHFRLEQRIVVSPLDFRAVLALLYLLQLLLLGRILLRLKLQLEAVFQCLDGVVRASAGNGGAGSRALFTVIIIFRNLARRFF